MKDNGFDSKIAIIGMSCRVPGADNPAGFWNNLILGVESIKTFTDEELKKNGIQSHLLNNPQYVKRGAVIRDIEYFDAGFFNYSPKDAEITDPQHRLFLECSWEALEDAACIKDIDRYVVGVYASSCMSNYFLNIYSNEDYAEKLGYVQIGIGNEKDFLASKVAYKLGLKGPAVNVQTACSSSLVAVHLASQSLLNGECDIALAGGVTIRSEQVAGYYYQKEGLTSPDGHCRVFDADSRGTVFGNGLGIVVLKRLTDAIRDKDNILAVICGTAVNNDGSEKIGYTAPSPAGQACVINEALAVAGLKSGDISYIETHGTGTELGDAVEIKALKEVFMEDGYRPQSCAIGSVKPNIGHLDVAAGIIGLIKTVLALQHNTIPPCINHYNPNPQIDLEKSPFFVNTNSISWKHVGDFPKAGVSSFGIGGTNAHVILEKAPHYSSGASSGKYHTFVFSAKNEKSLNGILKKMAAYFRQNPRLNPADIAFTLQMGRADFSCRRMFVCACLKDVISKLEEENKNPARIVEEPSGAAFVFLPQDSGIASLGYELYQSNKLFANKVDLHLNLLKSIIGETDYKEIIFGGLFDGKQPDREQLLNRELSLFVIENALADFLVELGIKPDLIIAAGIGIYAAVCQAGFISIDNVNKILLFKHELQKAGSERKKHIESEFSGFLDSIKIAKSEIRLIFNGIAISGRELRQVDFWLLNDEDSPQTPDSFLKTVNDKSRAIIVIGMGNGWQEGFLSLLPRPRSNEPVEFHLNNALGDMWLRGASIDWGKLYVGENVRRISLPTYSFNKERYWIERKVPSGNSRLSGRDNKKSVENWFYRPVWKQYGDVCRNNSDEQTRCSYIIFADPWGAGDKLKYVLSLTGNNVYLVKAGPEFVKTSRYEYSIDPAELEHYGQLFADVLKTEAGPIKIIHMWSIPAVDRNNTANDISRQLIPSFYSLLDIGKCLDMADIMQQIQLYVVTSGYQPVFGDENLLPHNAAVIGAVNVFPQEFTNVKCSLIDIISTDLFNNKNRCFDLLVQELEKPNPERILAIRGKYKWVQLFEPVPAIAKAAGVNHRVKNGTYVVFGGLGDIGLTIAEFLARNGCASLILVGRSEFPPKDLWASYLERDEESSKTANRIRRLMQIENLGVQVHIYQADVCDKIRMTQLFEEIDDKFNEVRGVIYSVGVIVKDTYSNSVKKITCEMCDAEFRARIEGVRILEEMIRSRDIRFCILNSSISAVLGGMGLVAYSAANHFMDVFAQKMNLNGSKTRWISINWDAWNFTSFKNSDGEKSNERLAKLIYPEEGQLAFKYLLELSDRADRIVVSTVDLNHRLSVWTDMQNKKDGGRKAVSNRNMPIEQILADTIKETMGISKIGPEDNFFELGITSMDIVIMNDSLQKKINKPILVSSWFQYPTMNKLAGYLKEGKVEGSSENGGFDRSEIFSRGLNTLKILKQKSKGVQG